MANFLLWDLSPEHRVRCLSDMCKYSNKDELFTDRSAGLIDGLLRFDIYIVDNHTSGYSVFLLHQFLHSTSFIRKYFSTIALILRENLQNEFKSTPIDQWTHCQITRLATLHLEISGQNNIGIQKQTGYFKVWFPKRTFLKIIKNKW